MDTATAIEQNPRTARRSWKSKTRGLLIAFAITMLALTLVSNTLMELSLPQVSAEPPSYGKLTFKVSGTGTIEPGETIDIMPEQQGWPVKEVMVKAGDQVTKGQKLVAFRTEDTELQLETERLGYKQQQLALEKLQNGYKEAVALGDDKQIADIARDIESAKLSLQAQQRKVGRLQEQLQRSVVTAPEDGIVTEVPAAVGATVAPGSAAVRLTKSSSDYSFKATVTKEQAEYVAVGDEIVITIPGLDDAEIKAKIESIEPKRQENPGGGGNEPGSGGKSSENDRVIAASVASDKLRGGESATFEWKKESGGGADSEHPTMLVPNGAIRESNEDGTFVYVVDESDGSLGKSYYLRKAKVAVKESDAQFTEVEDGLSPADLVVDSGSKPLEDGQRVRLSSPAES